MTYDLQVRISFFYAVKANLDGVYHKSFFFII